MKTQLIILFLLLSFTGFSQDTYQPITQKQDFQRSVKVLNATLDQEALPLKQAQDSFLHATDVVDAETIIGALRSNYEIRALQAMGSNVKVAPLFSAITSSTAVVTLIDGRILGNVVYIDKTMTLTGVKFVMATTGVYTGNNTNSITLFKLNGSTRTKVAETVNNINLWKGATGTVQTVAFATPYIASEGVYYLELLYNYSSQTTAPRIYVSTSISVAWNTLTDSKISFYINGNSSFPSTQANTSGTNYTIITNLFVY